VVAELEGWWASTGGGEIKVVHDDKQKKSSTQLEAAAGGKSPGSRRGRGGAGANTTGKTLAAMRNDSLARSHDKAFESYSARSSQSVDGAACRR